MDHRNLTSHRKRVFIQEQSGKYFFALFSKRGQDRKRLSGKIASRQN